MTIEELIYLLKPHLVIQNFENEIIELNIPFDDLFSNSSLGWISDKNINKLKDITCGNILISKNVFDLNKTVLNKSTNWIVVENPRKAFTETIRHFFIQEKSYGNIHPSAIIASSAKMNEDKINIGPNVVIEDNVEIGDFCDIGPNTVLKKGTILKSNIIIGSNCTIGGVGFGYEKDDDGDFQLIHHLGNVFISENVEIGNNVCIDRAVLGYTTIGKNVKIDNLVHIAHGVRIGQNSLIIANAMIGGSVIIGNDVWVSPSVSVKQKIVIEDNALVGMGSVVVKNINQNDIVAGVPAKSIKKYN